MSRENVEVVRAIYAPWGRGDFRSVEWAHPEIEFVVADFGPASGSWKGLAAMAEVWRAFLGAWEEYRTEVEEYRELDGERVLVLLNVIGRGKSSGVQLGAPSAVRRSVRSHSVVCAPPPERDTE